jgi:hypothetical protein
MRRFSFIALVALLLCGCANVEYTAYSGRQQNWPVASGSFVQRKFDLPVYFGAPDRPYQVLGYMEVESGPLSLMLLVPARSTQLIGILTPPQVAASTAITSRPTATRPAALGEPVRLCPCVEAMQPRLRSNFCKRVSGKHNPGSLTCACAYWPANLHLR